MIKLTEEEERALLQQSRTARKLGDLVACQRAIEELIRRGNWQGQLTTQAAKWVQEGADLEEFVQAGYVGLLEAIDRWSPKKQGWRTYAYFWVRKRMAELSRLQGAIVIEREHEVRLVNLVARVTKEIARTGKSVSVRRVQKAAGLTRAKAAAGLQGRRPKGWVRLTEGGE